MIVLTGAGGFIGSVMLRYLNARGIDDVILFDNLPNDIQYKNLNKSKFQTLYKQEEYEKLNGYTIDSVIHLGANSNTLEKNWSSLYKSNVESTRFWSKFCNDNKIPLIFASSAAVYGNGQGPLNQYAFSKLVSENEIDAVILRLFNVYGPNEYHKGRMSSTILHWFNEINKTQQLQIFEGSQNFSRDFIYVEDVCKTIYYFLKNYKPGIYDLGTGIAVDFDSLANTVINCMQRGSKNFIAMPQDIQQQYQKSTKADTRQLSLAGVKVNEFLTTDQGIELYIDYLDNNKYF